MLAWTPGVKCLLCARCHLSQVSRPRQALSSVLGARVGPRLRGFLSCLDPDCGWQGRNFTPLSEPRLGLVTLVPHRNIASKATLPCSAEVSSHSTLLPEAAYLACPALWRLHKALFIQAGY